MTPQDHKCSTWNISFNSSFSILVRKNQSRLGKFLRNCDRADLMFDVELSFSAPYGTDPYSTDKNLKTGQSESCTFTLVVTLNITGSNPCQVDEKISPSQEFEDMFHVEHFFA